jgi:molybdopterin-guanine dinucleotide biosynthesis protein A
MSRSVIAGAILAGGRSRRMGGEPKALLDLGGKPLLEHVIGRLRPQASRLMLSVAEVSPQWGRFGLDQVPDRLPGHAGPLGGLHSVLRALAAGESWLLLAPCDAPFLPLDLAQRLLECAVSAGRPVAAVHFGGHLQPTFSLWSRELEKDMEKAVMRDRMAGFMQYLDRVLPAPLEWPGDAPPAFMNINDRQSLEAARRAIETGNEHHAQC